MKSPECAVDASPGVTRALASLLRLNRWQSSRAEVEMTFLVRLLISAAALFLAARVVPGIRLGAGDRLHTPSDWMTLLVVAVIFGVVNAVVWPVVFWLTLPVTLATLGLFVLVINALMFLLTSRITGALGLGFRVDGFVPAFAGALVMSIVSLLLNYSLAANW
jgi:putative membrane protein